MTVSSFSPLTKWSNCPAGPAQPGTGRSDPGLDCHDRDVSQVVNVSPPQGSGVQKIWGLKFIGTVTRGHDSRASTFVVTVKSRARNRPAGPGLGRSGHLTTWSKERGKRQSEFGMEMQSNEVSGRNSSEVGSTRPLVLSTPAHGFIKERLW